MRALTVQQPWAWAIIHAGKDIENRTQLWNYRGPLAIHAGQRFNVDGGRDPIITRHPAYADAKLEFGTVIGVVDMVGAHRSQEGCCTSDWAQEWSSVHIELTDPRPLATPIECYGKLGIWTLPPDATGQIRRQLLGSISEVSRG